jgi:glucokinase
MTVRQTSTAATMRSLNRSAILNVLREHSPISRTEIATHVNASQPTVKRVVDDLIRDDFVRPCGNRASTGGRPSTLLEFNSQAYAVIGVDLGGTKIFGTVADLAGTIQFEKRVPWGNGGPPNSVERVCQLIEQLIAAPRPKQQKIRGIGIGAPGVTQSEQGIVTFAPSLGWRDLNLRAIMSKRFRLPVFVENDVNLATLGEWGFGIARGTENMVCLAIGTGIGAGVIIEDRLYRGHDQAAGEVGYLVPSFAHLGRTYDQFGALEGVASGTGIAERARQHLLRTGACVQDVTAEQVFDAARRREEWALDIVRETVDYLALAIANVSCVLNPQAIVLGGGVSNDADLLIEPILERIRGVVPYVPRLVMSNLGPRAAVMGAIVLVLHETTDHAVIHRLQKRPKEVRDGVPKFARD